MGLLGPFSRNFSRAKPRVEAAEEVKKVGMRWGRTMVKIRSVVAQVELVKLGPYGESRVRKK